MAFQPIMYVVFAGGVGMLVGGGIAWINGVEPNADLERERMVIERRLMYGATAGYPRGSGLQLSAVDDDVTTLRLTHPFFRW